MLKKGLLESRGMGITSDRGGRRKKFYVITIAGKRALDRQYELRTSLYQRILNYPLASEDQAANVPCNSSAGFAGRLPGRDRRGPDRSI